MTADPAEILLVDDDRAMRAGWSALLAGEGFAVRVAGDGEEALGMIAARRPDLVLLDVMMPKMNGFRCCGEIRKADRTLPVIFLTAKDAEVDQVRGIGLGADDFLSKDVDESVVLARIRRALDRAQDYAAAASSPSGRTLCLGSVTVNLNSLVVVNAQGVIAQLTKSEADLLVLLAEARGAYLSVDRLIAGLRGAGYACADTLVYSHVSHLRQKLGPAGGMIRSLRSRGYALIR